MTSLFRLNTEQTCQINSLTVMQKHFSRKTRVYFLKFLFFRTWIIEKGFKTPISQFCFNPLNLVSFLNVVSLFSSPKNETKLRRRFFQFSESKIIKYSDNETFEHEWKLVKFNRFRLRRKIFQEKTRLFLKFDFSDLEQ